MHTTESADKQTRLIFENDFSGQATVQQDNYTTWFNATVLKALVAEARAAALEEAAQTCEDTITFTTEHYARDDGGPCGWCEGLEKAAAAIRRLKGEGR